MDDRYDFPHAGIHKFVVEYIESLPDLTGKVVVDIPCGDGRASLSFKKRGATIKALDRYPESVMVGRAAYYYRLYLSTFVTGLRNSPVFDAAGALDPRLSTVYHEFASRHLLTRSGAIVREFYTLLRAADFRWSPPVRDFYEAHGITNMHRAQVPYR